jgi:hypothetical protein
MMCNYYFVTASGGCFYFNFGMLTQKLMAQIHHVGSGFANFHMGSKSGNIVVSDIQHATGVATPFPT